MPEVIKIDNSSVGLRIDKWIKINLIKIPQSLIEKDLRKGRIKVNNRKVKSSCLPARESSTRWPRAPRPAGQTR